MSRLRACIFLVLLSIEGSFSPLSAALDLTWRRSYVFSLDQAVDQKCWTAISSLLARHRGANGALPFGEEFFGGSRAAELHSISAATETQIKVTRDQGKLQHGGKPKRGFHFKSLGGTRLAILEVTDSTSTFEGTALSEANVGKQYLALVRPSGGLGVNAPDSQLDVFGLSILVIDPATKKYTVWTMTNAPSAFAIHPGRFIDFMFANQKLPGFGGFLTRQLRLLGWGATNLHAFLARLAPATLRLPPRSVFAPSYLPIGEFRSYGLNHAYRNPTLPSSEPHLFRLRAALSMNPVHDMGVRYPDPRGSILAETEFSLGRILRAREDPDFLTHDLKHWLNRGAVQFDINAQTPNPGWSDRELVERVERGTASWRDAPTKQVARLTILQTDSGFDSAEQPKLNAWGENLSWHPLSQSPNFGFQPSGITGAARSFAYILGAILREATFLDSPEGETRIDEIIKTAMKHPGVVRALNPRPDASSSGPQSVAVPTFHQSE